MRIRALIGAALLILLAGCGPRPSVKIRAMPTPAPEAAVGRAVSDYDTEAAFVLNPATGKFHRPGCTWAERMDPERRIEYSGDRQILIDVGYLPCHYCEP